MGVYVGSFDGVEDVAQKGGTYFCGKGEGGDTDKTNYDHKVNFFWNYSVTVIVSWDMRQVEEGLPSIIQ